VLRVLGDDYILVEGANRVKKHQKPNPMKGTTGGIIERRCRSTFPTWRCQPDHPEADRIA